jgi:hypothetical protein
MVLFGPAVLGVAALAGSIALFGASASRSDSQRTLFVVAGAVLLLVSLGVGACYGIVFLR